MCQFDSSLSCDYCNGACNAAGTAVMIGCNDDTEKDSELLKDTAKRLLGDC